MRKVSLTRKGIWFEVAHSSSHFGRPSSSDSFGSFCTTQSKPTTSSTSRNSSPGSSSTERSFASALSRSLFHTRAHSPPGSSFERSSSTQMRTRCTVSASVDLLPMMALPSFVHSSTSLSPGSSPSPLSYRAIPHSSFCSPVGG